MTIVQRMREALKDSMKARDAVRTNVLRYWIAQLTLASGQEMADAEAIQKMRGILKEARTGQTTWAPAEVAVIAEWVPASLSPEQIAEALAPMADSIRGAAKDGMAIGVAMKALAGRQVESEDVRAAVASIRDPGA